MKGLTMNIASSLSSFKKLYLEEQFSTLWPEARKMYSLNLRATAKNGILYMTVLPCEMKIINNINIIIIITTIIINSPGGRILL